MIQEPKIVATFTTDFSVIISVVEHTFFDTGKKFWDVTLENGFGVNQIDLDCKNKTSAMKLFKTLKETFTNKKG